MILALETSTSASSAAVFSSEGKALAERVDLEGPAHAQRLLPLVHEVLTEAAVAAGDLAAVVCGLGPGAYTGMRIGVATARALTQATGARLAGVPTLAAVASALAATAEDGLHLVPLLDGKRGEVFAACFRQVAAGLTEVSPLAVVPADELEGYLGQWPGAAVGGDGATLYADRLSSSLSAAVAAPTAAMIGDAWFAGVLGCREGFADVLPIYGREPDAARWTKRAPA